MSHTAAIWTFFSLRIVFDVIHAAPVHAANRHPHAIVRPEYPFRLGYESHAARGRQPCGAGHTAFQETPAA